MTWRDDVTWCRDVTWREGMTWVRWRGATWRDEVTGWEFWYHLMNIPSQFEIPWGGNFTIILSLWTLSIWSYRAWVADSMSIWSYMGFGDLDSISPLWTFQANSWEREFWYHHTLVETPRQFEVSWGWESWYHFTLVDIPCSCGWESSYPCEHAKSVWSSIGVEDLISSYPCEHAKSIWSSIGMGSLISSYSCGQPNSISNSMHVEL